MHHRVLDSADVLVHRQPVIHRVAAESLVRVHRAIAREIPRRFEKGIKGIGFPARRLAAARAIHLQPGRVAVERVAGGAEFHVFRQHHRQIVGRHRNHAAILAMDDGDGAAPIALARYPPIAEPEVDRLAPLARFHQPLNGRPFGVGDAHPVHETGVDHGAVAYIGFGPDGEAGRVLPRRTHHRHHRKRVLAREVEVALVVGGAAENGAGTVLHQHEVGDVDGQGVAFDERVHDAKPGIESLFFRGLDGRLAGAEPIALGDEGFQFGIAPGQVQRQRMVGGDGAEGGAEQGVRAGGVDLQPVLPPLDGERDMGAHGLADPFLLHQPHPVGPAAQVPQPVEQTVGEGGDTQEPLGQEPSFHRRARPPALAVHHLLVGQHGMLHRVPVHPGNLAIDQIVFQEIQEHLLFETVIVGVAGGDFPGPVVGQPHGPELAPHGGDVVAGPGGRVDAAFHRRVFRRKSEGIPAHGMQHVESAGLLVARHDVAEGIVAHVPHVDPSRRVWEHFKNIIFLPGRILGYRETAAGFPGFLPFGLDVLEVIACHVESVVSACPRPPVNRPGLFGRFIADLLPSY